MARPLHAILGPYDVERAASLVEAADRVIAEVGGDVRGAGMCGWLKGASWVARYHEPPGGNVSTYLRDLAACAGFPGHGMQAFADARRDLARIRPTARRRGFLGRVARTLFGRRETTYDDGTVIRGLAGYVDLWSYREEYDIRLKRTVAITILGGVAEAARQYGQPDLREFAVRLAGRVRDEGRTALLEAGEGVSRDPGWGTDAPGETHPA